MFQSSLGRKAGCNIVANLFIPTKNEAFQSPSSVALGATGGFNPPPAGRLEATSGVQSLLQWMFQSSSPWLEATRPCKNRMRDRLCFNPPLAVRLEATAIS